MINTPTNISFRHQSLKQEAKGQIICFRNCRLFRNGAFVQPPHQNELWVRNGRVQEPLKIFYEEKQRPNINVDCEGLILAPGLLDIQVNGAYGVDFTTVAALTEQKKAEEQIKLVAEKLLQNGVTGFCPTIITASPDKYKNFLKLLKNLESTNMSCIHGAHFEGPFINEEQSGCHPKEHLIQTITSERINSLYGREISNLSIVTLAPELEGANEAIRLLHQKGVKVSIGHSQASFEEATKAIACGANCITHVFNQTKFHHRDPGIVGILTNHNNASQLYYGIIADGLHLAESILQIAFCANPNGCILITDCISALGLSDGIHKLGSQQIKVVKNKAFIEGTNILAGSVSSMPHCMKYFASSLSKLPNKDGLAEALKAATFNPAIFLELHNRKGILAPSCDADFIITDDQLNIFATFINGVKCFES